MASVEDLIHLNSETADAVAEQAVFDGFAADLILRNTAVIADRLAPDQFKYLSSGAKDKVLDTVNVARQVAPLAELDREIIPYETPAEHQYRVAVWQPLHALQAKVHIGDYESDNPAEIKKLKAAVKLAGIAFESVALETHDLPEIHRTESYFWGNTQAASRRLILAAQDPTSFYS